MKIKRSILQEEKEECYLCGRNGSTDPLHKHHIFGGSNRKWSEKYGLFVWLCGNECHENGPKSAHRCKETRARLQEAGQKAWESEYGTREEFMSIFGRNYIMDGGNDE